MVPSIKKASSQVSWALLTEGVTKARVEVHRLHLLLDRALSLVENSEKKEHLWEVAGDLILGIPERIQEVELSLDRTSYALTILGEDFIRGRLPLGDRLLVDDGVKPHPQTGLRLERESSTRVAFRYLSNPGAAPSAESEFFDNPQKREMREFAESKAISNDPSPAAIAVRHMDNTPLTVQKARLDAMVAPPTPEENEAEPGGKEFGTLNRFIIETDEPNVPGVPENREELPMSKKPLGGYL